MKKLLVLALVVSMLAVTGSAFAADDPAGHDVGGHDVITPVEDTAKTEAAKTALSDSTTPAGKALAATLSKTNVSVSGTQKTLIIEYAAKLVGTGVVADAVAAAKVVDDIVTAATSAGANAVVEIPTASLKSGARSAKNAGAEAGTISGEAIVAALQYFGETKTEAASDGTLTTRKASAKITPVRFALGTTGEVQIPVPNDTTVAFASGATMTVGIVVYKDGVAVTTYSPSFYKGGSINAGTITTQANWEAVTTGTAVVLNFGTAGLAADSSADINVVTTYSSVATAKQGAAGGSGGGCVAGTSAAALALAVLGFVAVKRRA